MPKPKSRYGSLSNFLSDFELAMSSLRLNAFLRPCLKVDEERLRFFDKQQQHM